MYNPYQFKVQPLMPNIRYKQKRQQYLMPNIRPMQHRTLAPYPPERAFVDVTRTVTMGAVTLGAVGTIGVLGIGFAGALKP